MGIIMHDIVDSGYYLRNSHHSLNILIDFEDLKEMETMETQVVVCFAERKYIRTHICEDNWKKS